MIGKIIESREQQESWWIPFKAEDNLVKEFEKGNVSVIHPEYSTDEKVKEMVNVFEAIYKVGILPELNQRLDSASHEPSLEDIKTVALYIESQKHSSQAAAPSQQLTPQQHKHFIPSYKKIISANRIF